MANPRQPDGSVLCPTCGREITSDQAVIRRGTTWIHLACWWAHRPRGTASGPPTTASSSTAA